MPVIHQQLKKLYKLEPTNTRIINRGRNKEGIKDFAPKLPFASYVYWIRNLH